MTTFYDSALQKLSKRDERFQSYLTEITESYNSLYQRNRKLEDENESLRKDNLYYKQSNTDPQVLQNLRENNGELQRRMTQTYEDLTRVQDSLMNRLEEVKRLTEENRKLTEENTNLKERAANLDKNLKKKTADFDEITKELENVTNDRNQLLTVRDSFQDEITKLKNENNQVYC